VNNGGICIWYGISIGVTVSTYIQAVNPVSQTYMWKGEDPETVVNVMLVGINTICVYNKYRNKKKLVKFCFIEIKYIIL
jgi:hypothetical protein